MMIRSLAIVGALAATSRIAAADEDSKSPGTALGLSIGGTAVSLGVMIAGMTGQTNDRETMVGLASSLVTPSLGEWYAGKYLTVGMGLRAAGALAMIGGIAYSYCNDSGSQCSETLGHGLLAVGLIAYGGGIIYDIVMAPSAVDAYNTSHRVRATIGPAVLTPPSGPVMGVGLGGSF